MTAELTGWKSRRDKTTVSSEVRISARHDTIYNSPGASFCTEASGELLFIYRK